MADTQQVQRPALNAFQIVLESVRGFATKARAARFVLLALATIAVAQGAGHLKLVVPGAVVIAGLELYAEVKSESGAEWKTKAKRLQDMVEALEAELTTQIGDGFGLVTELLGELATTAKSGKDVVRGRVEQAVVEMAPRLCGPHEPPRDVRCCFFALEGDALVRQSFSGRDDCPRDRFAGGEPSGDHVLAIANAREAILERNTSYPQDGPVLSDRAYRTYIATPVYAGTKSYGVLFVDSPKPGDLDEGDKATAVVLGKLLGIALAMAG